MNASEWRLWSGVPQSVSLSDAVGLWHMDWRLAAVSLLLSYFVYEQLSLQWKRKWLPGPLLCVPLIGSIVTMISNPTKYWDDQVGGCSLLCEEGRY